VLCSLPGRSHKPSASLSGDETNRTRARHDEPILPTTQDKWPRKATKHGSGELAFQAHAPRRTARARARIRSKRTIGSGGPTPSLRPRAPLPQPGLAIRAVGGRTSPAAGGLRSKQGGSLSLSCSWPLLLLRCHASCCSGVQFSGSDSPSPPTQRSESRERVPPLGFSRGPRNNLACSSHRLRLRDPPLPRRSLSEAWWPVRSWLIQPPEFRPGSVVLLGSVPVEWRRTPRGGGFRLSNSRFPVAFSLAPLLILPRSNRFADNYTRFHLFHSTQPGCFPLKAAPLPTNFW
jgi:hypothetical protein